MVLYTSECILDFDNISLIFHANVFPEALIKKIHVKESFATFLQKKRFFYALNAV